jgi:hypothetical protein
MSKAMSGGCVGACLQCGAARREVMPPVLGRAQAVRRRVQAVLWDDDDE